VVSEVVRFLCSYFFASAFEHYLGQAARGRQPRSGGAKPEAATHRNRGECVRTGIIDRHFRTEALSEVGDLACRCPLNLNGDLHIRSQLRDYRR
jgi:hypothetical protein